MVVTATRPRGGYPDPPPAVSVVVAHFEQQPQLDRTLAALARQTYPTDLMEIIVVDDGSQVAPTVPVGVRLLTQDDRGFRLAAARNLGAAHARGPVLCFLDADTSPEPDYLRELTRLPALMADAVTVGTRRHADLATVPFDDPIESSAPAHELEAPVWLARAYERTRDLAESDHRSYRYLIGAVLACHRDLFDQVGGFDESFSDYGGEDWEWGYRAWLAGATFAHVPTAIAWHDGPDWSGRSVADAVAAKNREALLLTRRIPAVGSRGRGVRPDAADVVVEIATSHSPSALFVCVDSVLESLPHAVVVVPAADLDAFRGDQRIMAKLPRDDRALVRATVTIRRPVRVEPAAFSAIVESVATSDGPPREADLLVFDEGGDELIRIRSTRAGNRRARWGAHEAATIQQTSPDWMTPIDAEPDLEGYLGGWA